MNSQQLFPQGNGNHPALYLEDVFVEELFPLLFTCSDDNGNLYVVVCYAYSAECKEWLVTKTTAASVVNLLRNEITTRSIFTASTESVTIIRQDSLSHFTYRSIPSSDLPEQVLPTDGYTMEAEPDEFEDVICRLRHRI